ncbi:MAG: polymer-forming cytoskeletal protein [Candidatus Kariarchaeaceae archaeon]|jgi:cytoskeletal protein CcmA (bactofilin family)
MSLEDNLKKKLESGEITQEEYNDLLKKFSDLDLLSSAVEKDKKRGPKRHKWSFTGSASVDGDNVDGPVKVSGRLSVDGDLTCQELKISGATNIDGNLTVVEVTKISGALSVQGDGKFGDSIKTSGKMSIDNSLYLTGPMKISGKVNVTNDIIAGEPIKISGKLNSKTLQSKSTVTLSGKMNVQEDVTVEELISSAGGSEIGGNLQARYLEIGKKYRLRFTNSEYEENGNGDWNDAGDIESIPDLGKFISRMVKKFVPMTMSSMGLGGDLGTPRTFVIGGNVEATEVDISHTHVKGDVIADDIKIGPGVIVDGTIKYKNSIELPEDSDLKVEKLG